jgi:hypothetical protein
MESFEQNDLSPPTMNSVRRPNLWLRPLAFVVLFLFLPVSVPTIFFINGGLGRDEVSVDDQFGDISEFPDADVNSVNLLFQAISFNPESQTAEFNVFPWPTDDLANPFDSSTQLNKDFGPIQIWIDSTSSENDHQFEPGESIGAIKAEIDVLSDFEGYKPDSHYPFDAYRLNAFAQTFVAKTVDEENVEWEPINTFDFFYTTPIPGFSIAYERKANYTDPNRQDVSSDSTSEIKSQRKEGLISFQTTITRSSAVKTISVIIAIFCLMSALTLTWISTGIWTRRRPPSMQALVWAAATVLGTVQLRDILPGHPRIGIAMDFIFFFPTLLVGLISSLLITTLWIRRDDWEI